MRVGAERVLRARTEETTAMAGEKLHSCTLTVNPMYGPIPCEACAEMPRCPHGRKADVEQCDSCETTERRARP